MQSNRSGLILGFHGCDKKLRDQVLLGKKELIPSNNHWDWLGHGIYFWENNPSRALDFAKEQVGRANSKINIPAVIGAVIDLGYCLDLMDMENIQLVKKAYANLIKSYKLAKVTPPENRNPVSKKKENYFLIRSLDCAVINYLNSEQDKKKKFVSVKGMFPEGEPLYANAGFREKDHIQICIRDSSYIKGYFLPR